MALLVSHPKLVSLFGFWQRLRGGRPMPSREDFDVFDVREWLGHLHLVLVLERGREFRHMVYGTELAVKFGVDLTGKTTEVLSPDARDVLLRAYREVVTRRQPWVLEADPVLTSTLWRVEDLLLPLSSDGRRVDRLLVGAYPVAAHEAALPALIDRRSEPRIPVLVKGMLSAGSRSWFLSHHGLFAAWRAPGVRRARGPLGAGASSCRPTAIAGVGRLADRSKSRRLLRRRPVSAAWLRSARFSA